MPYFTYSDLISILLDPKTRWFWINFDPRWFDPRWCIPHWCIPRWCIQPLEINEFIA